MDLIINENSNTQINKALFGDYTGKIKTFAIMSPCNPMGNRLTKKQNEELIHRFKSILKDGNIHYTQVTGYYGNREESFILYNCAFFEIRRLCGWRCFDQESFIFGFNSDNGVRIQYWERPNSGNTDFRLADTATGIKTIGDFEDYFTKHKGMKFSIDFPTFKESLDNQPDIINEEYAYRAISGNYTHPYIARVKMYQNN